MRHAVVGVVIVFDVVPAPVSFVRLVAYVFKQIGDAWELLCLLRISNNDTVDLVPKPGP